MAEQVSVDQVCKTLDDMASSMASARETIRSLKDKHHSELETKDGISLLSLKHHLMLSYLQSLLLVSSRKALGHSLNERSPPRQKFTDPEREERGTELGDLVDSMIEGRVILEKVKALEGRMKYQIEKLVNSSRKDNTEKADVVNDPLAFRPNPQNLVDNVASDGEASDRDSQTPDAEDQNENADGIYRPPRVAPMPYIPPTSNSKSKRQRQEPVPTSLATLLHTDGIVPHVEGTSGLGNTPSLNMLSSRAKYLKRLNEFEEEQFGRVMMGKKEARRRRRDEEDLALGGGLTGVSEDGKGGGRRRGTAGGWEDEFGDVLRDVGRTSKGALGRGDGYEELRQRGKRGNVLERSRSEKNKKREIEESAPDGGRQKKRSRFESERKNIRRSKA
ncbi:hypothetical protein K435DRAFT_849294 [Dendrothele bispora CBS 962.96]|uniref:Uncharacterized protein n=1 Tax=Dendrothele bispora (strain CBS 962.96) TaxID=1314807 RepID=A0A4S8MT76_DENBC|nr:hypothetical protein K435DRAFT_849294 [Dendrothele bispora CBS 962.96]